MCYLIILSISKGWCHLLHALVLFIVIMIIIETKYTTFLSQLHHPFYLLHLPDLFLSQVFPSPLSILLSFIILVIIVCYLWIITMKKLMNLNCLACYRFYAYFVSVDSLSARAGPTFDLICIVYKSFSRIL